jgi:DNA adenine methylase
MRPFFCRQGSKRKYAKALISLFPAHHTYVEPFLGGGAVFWAKEPSPKEIINDLDSDLIRDYRLLRNVPLTGSPFKLLTTEQQQNAFLRKTHRAKKDQLLEALLRRCNGYGGTYIAKGTSAGVYTDDRKGRVHKVTTHEDKLSAIAEYRTRIRHATLLNESYDDVIRKYDGRRTFIFLDPPYEKSVGLDYAEGSDAFPFRQFADDLRKVKGKFLVTINDSPAIRDLFKGFKLYPYVVKGHHAKSAIGKEDRKELLITNYPLARDWKSRMTKGTLKGGAYECEDEDEMEGSGTHKEDVLEELDLPDVGHSVADLAKASGVPLSTLQEVYNRGIGAYKTNPTSVRMKGSFKKGVDAPMSQKLSKEQWAMARVYSFLNENPKHDQDLRGGVAANDAFDHQLGVVGYSPMTYIRDVRRKAKKAGYNPDDVGFAKDGTHKLLIHTPDGRTVKFGRVGYGDHLLWTHMEKRGKAPPGTSAMKRRVFRKSHTAMKGNWKSDKFSPNNLALAILW